MKELKKYLIKRIKFFEKERESVTGKGTRGKYNQIISELKFVLEYLNGN